MVRALSIEQMWLDIISEKARRLALKRVWARIWSQDLVEVANIFVAVEYDDWDGFWNWGGGFFVGGGVVGVEVADLCSWGGGRKGMFV